MNILRRISFVAIILIPTISVSAPNTFTMIDDDCKTMGHQLGQKKIDTDTASKSRTTCIKFGNAFNCTHGDVKDNKASAHPETYNITLDENGVLMLKSASGNIVWVIDMNSKRYALGQTNFTESLVMINKQCTGRVEK